MIFSYTLLSTFHDVCPRQAHERFWLKIPVAETPEMQTGTRVHKYIEEAVTGKDPLPAWLAHVNPVLASLMARGGEAMAEQKLAVNRSLQATGFWDGDAWLRGSIDFLLLSEPNALVVDWKTGKKRDKDLQLLLYALFVFAKYELVEAVTCVNYFVAENQKPMGQPFTWRRSEVPEMWRRVVPLIHEIELCEAENRWVERPSGLCSWCPVEKCQHWRPRR